MMLSAPLLKTFNYPLSSLTMTDIRFLAESNSNDLRSWNFFSYPLITNFYSLADAPVNLNPKWAAASTNVISSGDGPW